MCLSAGEGGHEDYTRLARAMDDERLRQLDRYYRDELGLAANTAEMELHSIVICELEIRRQERIRRFKRSPGSPAAVADALKRPNDGWYSGACGAPRAGV